MERVVYECCKPSYNIFISAPQQINKFIPVTEEGKLRVGSIYFLV